MKKHPLEAVLAAARKQEPAPIALRAHGLVYELHYNKVLHWYIIERRDNPPGTPASFYGRRAQTMKFLLDNAMVPL
jgi:hypothetical protein